MCDKGITCLRGARSPTCCRVCAGSFMTAKRKFQRDALKKGGQAGGGDRNGRAQRGEWPSTTPRRTHLHLLLTRQVYWGVRTSGGTGMGGARSGGLKRKFVPPSAKGSEPNTRQRTGGSSRPSHRGHSGGGSGNGDASGGMDDEDVPEELRGIEPKLIELIENEIIDSGTPITFEDIGESIRLHTAA